MNRTITFLVDKQVKKYFVSKWIRYSRNKFTLYGGDNIHVPYPHSYFFLEFADILGVEYKVKDYNDEIDDSDFNWYVIPSIPERCVWDTIEIPKIVLNRVQNNKNIRLMYFWPNEGMYQLAEHKLLLEFLEKNKIPLDKFNFLHYPKTDFNQLKIDENSSIDANGSIKKTDLEKLKKINWNSENNFLGVQLFTYISLTSSHRPTAELKFKKRNRHFILLNRTISYDSKRVKYFRAYPLARLHSNGLLKKGYFSLINSNNISKKLAIQNFSERSNNLQYQNSFLFLINLSPHKLPSEAKESNVTETMNYDPPKEIEDAYFSIISEETRGHGSFQPQLLTEKTWKALYQLNPFIIISKYQHLKFLRTLGFETFPEWFDESYDEIEDDDERMFAVCAEVERLCKLPIEKLHEMYVSIWPKLIRNRTKFLTYNYKELYESWFSYEN